MNRNLTAVLSGVVAGLLAFASAQAESRVLISAHGAVGDGQTLNTEAIQTAIEHCSTNGGGVVVVPAGTFHNVINTSATLDLKLYTIYSPPNHKDGTVHKTKAEADVAETLQHQ